LRFGNWLESDEKNVGMVAYGSFGGSADERENAKGANGGVGELTHKKMIDTGPGGVSQRRFERNKRMNLEISRKVLCDP
jgi:hypothetical protein